MSLDPTLFTRDSHLQDLALERLVIEDLTAGEVARVRDHLADCPACIERMKAIQSELASPLPELVHAGARAPARGELGRFFADLRRYGWFAGGLGAALVVAGVALVIALPKNVDPRGTEFRDRGAALSFEVYRQDDGGAVRVRDGDGVRPGDRLGFRVASREDGHLVVLGVDSALNVYPCFPLDAAGGPAAWTASPQPVQLGTAIQLDATPGQERLVALLCERPVGFEQLSTQLMNAATDADSWADLPPLHGDCLQQELRVRKLEEGP